MDKFINAILKMIWQIVFFIVMMILLFVNAKNAKGEIPPPVRGENFQRPLFIDCQNYKIERFKGVHTERDFTVCFYESYFIDGDGKQVKIIIPISQIHDVKIIIPGQIKR